jgi:amino acid permease
MARKEDGSAFNIQPASGLPINTPNRPTETKGLLFTSVVNLFQTIVGIGILTLPAAFHDGGAGIGTFNTVFMGSLSMMGFLAIGKVCYATGATTYREAWAKSIGKGEAAVDFIIFIETTLVMISYMIVMIDYIQRILKDLCDIQIENRFVVSLIVTIPILVPLSLQPKLHNLRFSSFFGNCAVFYTVCFVLVNLLLSDSNHLRDAPLISDDYKGVFRATAVLTRAFQAHYNAPDIFMELSEHPRQWPAYVTSVLVSFGSVMLFYTEFALSGYARWGAVIKGNVLLNYGTSAAIMVAWLSMLITMITSFALHVKPSRDGLARSLGLTIYCGKMQEEVVRTPFTLVSLSLVVFVVAFGSVLKDISWLMAFGGALLSFPISMIIPGLMLVKCPNTGSLYRVCGLLLVAAGIFSSCLGLYCRLID